MTRDRRATVAQKALSISIATSSAALLAFVLHAECVRTSSDPKGMAPQVAITNPADRSRVPWQAQGSYSVAVSYDGRSTRYGDIPSNHVLVAATYLPDVDKVPALKDAEVPPAGLIAMTQSNCMGCHDFTTTAVGPSFAAIGKHYPDASSIGTLADHIRTGSAGTWGTTRMPPHPDLDSAQASAMARWIVEHANDPAVRYHVGADGMFRMEAPAVPGPRAGIMLTAAYTGPLKPGDSRHTEGGRNTVILEGIGR